MILIKVTEDEKKLILRQISEKLDFLKLRDEDESLEEDNIFPTIDQINVELDKLKNENILSQTLIRMVSLDVSIGLSAEMQDRILNIIKDEDEKLYFRNKIKNDTIEWTTLRQITDWRNIIENLNISLDENIKEFLLLCLGTTTIDDIRSSYKKSDLFLKIKNGNISYDEYNAILNGSLFISRDAKDEYTDVLFAQYNSGKISEEEVINILGSKENPFIIEFLNNYNERKRQILEGSIELIFSDYEKINFLQEQIPEDLKKILENLLSTFDLGNIKKLDLDALESFVNKYNIISEQIWKRYLDGKDNFLIHVTDAAIKGDFRDPQMSTSLISLSDNFSKTYRNRYIGYQIKPKKILKADAQDVYTINDRQDLYASSRGANIVVRLPQIIKEADMQPTDITEIVLSDFEIEAVVCLSNKIPEFEMAKFKEYSEVRGNIPIKLIGPNGLITLEESQILTILQKFENIINVKLEKLSDVQIDIIVIQEVMQKIRDVIKNPEFDQYSESELEQIKSFFSDTTLLESLIDDLYKKEREKFIQTLGNEMQDIFSKKEKMELDQEHEMHSNFKVNFLSRLFGGERLRQARLHNIELRKKLIMPQKKNYTSIEEILCDVNTYIQENGINDDIKVFVSKCETLKLGIKSRQIISKIKETISLSNQTRDYLPIATKKVNLFDIRKQAEELENHNRGLESMIVSNNLHKNENVCETYDSNDSRIEFNKWFSKAKKLLISKEKEERRIEHEIFEQI